MDKTTTQHIVVIREKDCIGCTKCIQACPVDAIIGASKWMHTVIVDNCIGCKLCISPCPVDCIDLIPAPKQLTGEEKKSRAAHLKQRYQARKKRLEDLENAKRQHLPTADKKAYIKAALQRCNLIKI